MDPNARARARNHNRPGNRRGGRGRGGYPPGRGGHQNHQNVPNIENPGPSMVRNNSAQNMTRRQLPSDDTSNGDSVADLSTRKRKPNESPLSFNELKELLEKQPSEVVVTLRNVMPRLNKRLRLDNLSADFILNTLKALFLVTQCQMCPVHVMDVLNEALSSDFCSKHLPLYLKDAPFISKEAQRLPETFDMLMLVMDSLLQRFPHKASDKLDYLFLTSRRIIDSNKNGGIPLRPESCQKLKELEDSCQQIRTSYDLATLREKAKEESDLATQPEEDFRAMSIILTHGDIHEILNPFLRPNIIGKKFPSVDIYLDIHFRLLREDFIAPLRDGLCNYLSLVQRKKQNEVFQRDLKIYYEVRVCFPSCSPGEGIVHKLKFDVSKLKRVRWEATKRLMHGSLICLSSNQFETFHLATIVQRNPKELKEGYVIVKFILEDDRLCEMNPNELFTMVESPAYYEAYGPVLRGLQLLHDDHLPFQRYFINAETDVMPPRYLKNDTLYKFSTLMDDVSHSGQVRVLHDEAWPTAADFKLDPAQYLALKTALTKEVAVIQGPPGTGKTFLGLKIMQVLLDNKNIWSDGHGPILVICYTNHALDQFLEGILKFCSEGIVRIGGQSKCEAFKTLNLSHLRKIMTDERKVPLYVYKGRKKLYYELKQIEEDIDQQLKSLKRAESRLLHERELENFMANGHFHQLISGYAGQSFGKNSTALPEWLGIAAGTTEFDEDSEQAEGHSTGAVGKAVVPVANAVPEDDNAESEEEDALAVEEMQRRIVDDLEVKHFDSNPDNDGEQLFAFGKNKDGWQIQGGLERLQKIVSSELKKVDVMSADDVRRSTDLWEVWPFKKRWSLYRYWLSGLRSNRMDHIQKYQQEYQEKYRVLKEILRIMDMGILEDAKVIGMTTTGAAKNRDLLQAIKPKIIIVEEAAEVLESHIITALSEECEHLIMIGDQQQLRPNTTVYKLAHHYHLDVSLFERLIKVGVHYNRLALQHRMRPEIASLLVPHIYPDLKNHESVEQYDKVTGLQSNVFFISHKNLESAVADSTSRENKFEAEFLIELCKYLLMQGYEPTQITILTTYLGQLHLIRRLSKHTIASSVRQTVVDNYQGEENDIILLSLVRSNVEGQAGFLKVDNRVCVALSRAKKGLFCVGNFDFLAENATIWQTIIRQLEDQGLIGPTLVLQCQNHPKTCTNITRPSDFKSVPEGGCRMPCEFRLPCGHQCPKACHAYDMEHKNTKCLKPCQKPICDLGHRCPKQCYQNCDQCTFPVMKDSPYCGHTNKMSCSRDPETFRCTNPCVKKLSCGHQCSYSCGEPCGSCRSYVKKTSRCGHMVNVLCFLSDKDTVLLSACEEPCKEVLPCGHRCIGFCSSCHQGRMHVRCKENCNRTLICGHTCKVPCARSCPPCNNKCENRCIHSKCQSKCSIPCKPCKEKCAWQCRHEQCTKLCHELCDRIACNEPCLLKLPCGHPCIGMCGENCPTLCRICDRDQVCDLFFGSEDEPDARFVLLEDCGHIIEVQALDHWMTQGTAAADSSKNIKIEMKVCPKCKTVIRQNLRYGNIIKPLLEYVIDIKSKYFGDQNMLQNCMANLRNTAAKLDKYEDFMQARAIVSHDVQNLKRLSLPEVQSINHKVKLLNEMLQLWLSPFPNAKHNVVVRERLIELEGWFVSSLPLSKCPSEKEFQDFSRELQRVRFLSSVLKGTNPVPISGEPRACFDHIMKDLEGLFPFTEEIEKKVVAEVARLKRLGTGLGISDVEKREILQALNLSQGHWFKCPNGHYYIITECGGAMEEGHCNECGAAIGGGDHALRRDNRHAGEMDGSRAPSYPTLQRY